MAEEIFIVQDLLNIVDGFFSGVTPTETFLHKLKQQANNLKRKTSRKGLDHRFPLVCLALHATLASGIRYSNRISQTVYKVLRDLRREYENAKEGFETSPSAQEIEERMLEVDEGLSSCHNALLSLSAFTYGESQWLLDDLAHLNENLSNLIPFILDSQYARSLEAAKRLTETLLKEFEGFQNVIESYQDLNFMGVELLQVITEQGRFTLTMPPEPTTSPLQKT